MRNSFHPLRGRIQRRWLRQLHRQLGFGYRTCLEDVCWSLLVHRASLQFGESCLTFGMARMGCYVRQLMSQWLTRSVECSSLLEISWDGAGTWSP